MMENKELQRIKRVTILMTCYQSQKYLPHALESVLKNKQDLLKHNITTEIELLIIDDGSTDETETLVRDFEKANQGLLCINYIKQENQGQSQAFENSLKFINGDIVMLLDSDDKFLPSKVRIVAETFEKNPTCGMLTHPQWAIEKEMEEEDNINKETKHQGEGRDALQRKLHPNFAQLSSGDMRAHAKQTGRIIAPATSGLSFRTSLFKKIHPNPACKFRPYDLPDLYFALAASIESPIIALPNPLSEYRRSDSGKFFNILSTVEGLETHLQFQKELENKLDIKSPISSNSFLARIKFVHAKMTQEKAQWLRCLNLLMLAIFKDKGFRSQHKIAMVALWSGLAVLPKRNFWNLYLWLLKKQLKA